MPEDYVTPPPPPPPPPPAPYAQTPHYTAPPPYAGYQTGYPTPYGVPPPKRRSPWFYAGVIGACLAGCALLITFMVWSTVHTMTGGSDGLGIASSRIGVIDITGVPTVDTLVAQHLIKTVTAARLMGAECIISGIRPQIAQTIVHLGVDLSGVATKASLADAFKLALQRASLHVTRTIAQN